VRKCALPVGAVEACPADQLRWLACRLPGYRQFTLNPHNRGYGFFVYGDFPVILVRYVAECWGRQDTTRFIWSVGRSQQSAIAEIVLIYLIASRLYDRRVALLAAHSLGWRAADPAIAFLYG